MTGKGRDARPFLRWIGGKSKNIDSFTKYLPDGFENMLYVEPFLGSGAMFLKTQPLHAIVSDINASLVNAWISIKQTPVILSQFLAGHDECDNEAHYYNTRDAFNIDKRNNMSSIRQDARFIYLNARCFNGLYRENSRGEMNAPYAKDLKGLKKICNKYNMIEISDYLDDAHVTIHNKSYVDIIPVVESRSVDKKVFFFLDPPYYPVSITSSFTSYNKNAWKDDDFSKLKEFVDKINEKGWLFLLCNHSVPFINDLFKKYDRIEHLISRSVSCKANDRKPVMEILVANYNISRKQKKVKIL